VTPRTVAVFDFDGTITRRDSLLGFLAAAVDRVTFVSALLRTAPRIATMSVGLTDRDAAKERLLAAALGGRRLSELDAIGQRYARVLLQPRRLRDNVVARLVNHSRAGHEVVIVSASPETYVKPVAEALGAVAVASRLEVGSDGCVTGRLIGGNCRGHRKVVRLEEWLAADSAVVYAYGDSAGDREMLERADFAFKVGRGGVIRPLRP
jgi:phosphatidylglycerophosphatase C